MEELIVRKQFREIAKELELWGEWVKNKLSDLAYDLFGSSCHIQIDANFRVKDIASYCEKAICRYKYENPIYEVTDKVGVRIVLLTKDDVMNLSSRIASESKAWNFLCKSRDTELDILKNPEMFSYESEHFIVKPTENYDCLGIERDKLTCEIQVRTLLQHAYAEASHDTIYKNQFYDGPKARRLLASSMAFIEEADNKIVQVYQNVTSMDAIGIQIRDRLVRKYQKYVPTFMENQYDERLSSLFQNIFHKEDLEDFLRNSETFFDKYDEFISSALNKYHTEYFLFGQPIVLLCFYEVKYKLQTTLDNWPYGYESFQLLLKSMNITSEIL